MASKSRELEFIRWPRYKQLYINAFDRMLQARKERNKLGDSWRMGTTGTDVFNWWMEYDVLPGQVDLFEEEDYE
jgi:phosphoadenosine phosphosulfate reductase